MDLLKLCVLLFVVVNRSGDGIQHSQRGELKLFFLSILYKSFYNVGTGMLDDRDNLNNMIIECSHQAY